MTQKHMKMVSKRERLILSPFYVLWMIFYTRSSFRSFWWENSPRNVFVCESETIIDKWWEKLTTTVWRYFCHLYIYVRHIFLCIHRRNALQAIYEFCMSKCVVYKRMSVFLFIFYRDRVLLFLFMKLIIYYICLIIVVVIIIIAEKFIISRVCLFWFLFCFITDFGAKWIK